MPIDCRKPSGKTVSVISAAATVTALKTTVRPAVRHRRADRVRRRLRCAELLAVAGDEEERVVDRQAEAEADHEVEREDRERVDLVDGGQREEGAEHGGDARPRAAGSSRGRGRTAARAAAGSGRRAARRGRGPRRRCRRSGCRRTAEPPSVDAAARRRSARRGAAATSSSSASARRVAATEARPPVSLTKPSSRVDMTDAVEAMPGSPASERSSPAIRSRPAADSEPPGSSASRITPALSWRPVAASMRSVARAEPESSGVKPPSSSSCPATGPPRKPRPTRRRG